MRRWRKRGQIKHAFGRSRGGFSTKIHAACDALGNPVRFILTGGHVSDYVPSLDLIAGFKPHAVLADKGYDGDSFISAIKAIGAHAVVPPRKNRTMKRECDYVLYKERNKVECLFGKLKQWRRIATRYDKTDQSFIGFILLASIILWIN